jgi:hypothetical protein
MGCDIHVYAERKINGKYWSAGVPECLGYMSYRLFGFLAGVRNYSAVEPISLPRGIPEDASPLVKGEHEGWSCDAHNASWLSIEELAEFDYSKETEDRRCSVTKGNFTDGGCTCEPGQGDKMSYEQFLGEDFVKAIQEMKEDGVDRIVFWFDN